MLILFPVPIGSDDIALSLPPDNAIALNTCHHFIVEQERTARRNLKRMGYRHAIDDTTFFILNKHTTDDEFSTIVDSLMDLHTQGLNVGLMSEAGLPCVADPGSRVVAQAHRIGIPIQPLVGPSSLFLALMASGFNGQNFAFLGYLPIPFAQRKTTLTAIVRKIRQFHQTQIFIETPYRNNATLSFLANSLPPDISICVASDITLPSQNIRTLPAPQWRISPPDFNRHYCVFLLNA